MLSLSGVTKTINTKELGNTKEKERLGEWLELGESVPRVLSLCKDLPRVHTPRLFMLLTKRKADWLKALQEFKPQDILALQEHLPAHLAAAHPYPSGCEMLKLIIAGACTRDCLRARPSWHAANPPCVFEQWQ